MFGSGMLVCMVDTLWHSCTQFTLVEQLAGQVQVCSGM